jgi:hypothetical protein
MGQQDFPPHAMNGNAAERLSDGRHRAYDIQFAGLPDFVERERTVLAARPGDQRLWPRRHQ